MNLSELFRFLGILIITLIITKITKKAFKHSKTKDTLHIKFIQNLAIGAEWVIGAASALYSFSAFQHIAGTLLAGSGIVAIILGLAAQESFANLFSGIFICLFKTFNIGDRISIDNDSTYGFVEDITLRHTVIRTYTNVKVLIPNSIIAKSKIENTTYSDEAAYPIEVVIAYENKEKRYKAMEIMADVVKSHPLFYQDRADSVNVLCTAYEESGIRLKVVMWTKTVQDNIQACSDCRIAILDRFEQEGIEIPYNKVVVYNHKNK